MLHLYQWAIDMAPTIRIDDEVYEWLQKQARPFEDTPNSVLRRVAGLDEDGSQTRAAPRATPSGRPAESKTTAVAHGSEGSERLRGATLNSLWNVGARHALYRETGDWYQNLKKFPGALFDAHGYVLFETEADYRGCPQISIAQTTHVPGGIHSMPRYVRMK